VDGLHAAIDAAESAGDFKIMIIESSVDSFFAAGANIKHLATIDAETFIAYGATMRAVNDRLAASNWISIAAVDGLALGGGMELALACTTRVCGPDAKLGLPKVKIGLIPGAGGTQRLPQLVGRGRALDLMLTPRQVGTKETVRIGLADPLTNDPALEAASDLADELSGASLTAQLAVIRGVNAAFDLPLADGAVSEVGQEQDLFEHGDALEGISAFVAKREPRYA
jgi:enoyl-CoA hydratase